MSKVELIQKQARIVAVATEAFNYLMSLSPDIRQDEQGRTGIAVLAINPNDNNNLVYFFVGRPSMNDKFYAVKKAISSFIYGDVSSQNKENPLSMDFPGCLTLIAEDDSWSCQASISGLKSEENVAVAVLILAEIFEISPREVLRNVRDNCGELPKQFRQKGHYLHQLLRLGE